MNFSFKTTLVCSLFLLFTLVLLSGCAKDNAPVVLEEKMAALEFEEMGLRIAADECDLNTPGPNCDDLRQEADLMLDEILILYKNGLLNSQVVDVVEPAYLQNNPVDFMKDIIHSDIEDYEMTIAEKSTGDVLLVSTTPTPLPASGGLLFMTPTVNTLDYEGVTIVTLTNNKTGLITELEFEFKK